jgi:CRISPR/Cas system-associated protein Cas5 (RAMP superfamily)
MLKTFVGTNAIGGHQVMIISEANSCVNDNTYKKKNQTKNKLGYVYRHIRLDTNMPFYIGIGTMDNGKYSRSKEKGRRSDEWEDVAKGTDYRIEILLKDLPYNSAKESEKYFIKLYGRVDLGTGTLVNKTTGGDGCHGYKHSDEIKMKIGDRQKFKVILFDEFNNLIKSYDSLQETKEDGFIGAKISLCLSGDRKSHNGFRFEKVNDKLVHGKAVSTEERSKNRYFTRKRSYKVMLFDENGNFIKEYKTVLSMEKDGFCNVSINYCIKVKLSCIEILALPSVMIAL